MTNTLLQLESFVHEFNSGYFINNAAEMLERTPDYVNEVSKSYLRQYCDKDSRTHIGLSEIGKPAVLLGLKKLGCPAEVMSQASKMRFHFGDIFEALIGHIMQSYGIKLTNTQDTVELDGVLGHIDGIVNGDTVIEVKTMSDRYYTQFLKQPNDDRGYVTQLNAYTHAKGMKGAWLCLNKTTFQLALLPMIKDPLALDRATNVIAALKQVQKIEDVFDYFDPPEPDAEFFKKAATGKWLVPDSMKYSPFVDVFYETVTELNGYKKPTVYVINFRERKIGSEIFTQLKEIPF